MVQMNLFAGDDQEGLDSGGLKRERIYAYIELIHLVVCQKLTQHCKAVILKKRKRVNRESRETALGRELGLV